MDKIDILQQFIKHLEDQQLLPAFIKQVLEYPLTPSDEALVSVSGNNSLILLYLYIKNMTTYTNQFIIYNFINDYLSSTKPNHQYTPDIHYQNIYLKNYLQLNNCSTPQEKFAHYLSQDQFTIKDLLATF